MGLAPRAGADTLRPEDRLVVVSCCGPADATSRRAQVEPVLQACRDWGYLMRVALENRAVVPVARDVVASVVVPPTVRREFVAEAAAMERAARAARQNFERILPWVVAEQPVILLRGIAYAYTLYEQRFVRPVGDIDFLVANPARASISGRLMDHYHVPAAVMSRSDRRGIEYHHDFNVYWGFRISRIDMPGLWARRRSLAVDGIPVGVLSPEDDFVCVAHHTVVKGFTRLYRFMDLLEILRRHELDWGEVRARAAAFGVSRSVWLTCRVLNDVAEGAVPADVMDALRPGRVSEWLILRLYGIDLVLHDPNPRRRTIHGSRSRNLRKQLLVFLLLADGRNWYKLILARAVEALMGAYAAAYRVPYVRTVLTRARSRLQGES